MRFIQTFQLYDFLDTLVSLLTAFLFGNPDRSTAAFEKFFSKNSRPSEPLSFLIALR
jgi:hypothetical protein